MKISSDRDNAYCLRSSRAKRITEKAPGGGLFSKDAVAEAHGSRSATPVIFNGFLREVGVDYEANL